VKIKRVAKSFTDLQTTLKLAVSSNKAPDIVEANQGRPIMGQLVKGGLLKPLDAYADAYGWKDRWSKTLLDLNRFSADGKEFGTGNLYGVSQQGEIVGVFYNKDKVKTVPSTFAEFEQMLAKAKKAGEVPISFGNLDKFGGIHEFQTVQNAFTDKQATRDFVFAKDGASFDTNENREAATKLQEWADKGYFTPNFNGTGYDPAWQQFTKGKGPFTIAGTWITNDALKALGLKLGFFLMPGREAGGDPVALGGESLPWAITSKSKHADVAAAYIDFLTNAEAADVQVETGNLPAMAGASVRSKAPAVQDIFTAWKDLGESDGLTPYMDYATPTFYDDFSGAVQKLMAGKLKPGAFTKGVQADYAKFTDKQ
jgi:raffinose/stachyose/melibiose transport system substrate-binding protein